MRTTKPAAATTQMAMAMRGANTRSSRKPTKSRLAMTARPISPAMPSRRDGRQPTIEEHGYEVRQEAREGDGHHGERGRHHPEHG